MSANWTFYLNAPELDHMEQNAPHTSTQEHTVPTFPDSVAGTSSEHQPHEEYDYTSMKTSLDDVLSELRHQNDDEVHRYILLSNIQR